ncbi:MAG: GGDEF domain-containing protein [Gammaproteobacteria bacterium]
MKNDKKDVKQGINVGKTIIQIVITIATIELCIMAFMANYLHNIPATVETALDALLLALLSAPFIYFWIIKPYVDKHDKDEIQLSHMAYHDHLTLLPNRRYLSEHLKKYLSICKRHNTWSALLLIDINDFKVINDTYGYDIGDIVLKETAKRLSSTIRAEDIASRMGADEFAVAIHPLENNEEEIKQSTKKVAEKLQIALQKPITFNDQQLQIDVSIGVRILSADNPGIDTILKDADTAMSFAKKNQHLNNTCIFYKAAA